MMGYTDNASLLIDGAAVTTHNNGICNIKGGITLTKCEIMEPEGAVIKDGAIVNADGTYPTQVLIDNPDVYYGFSYYNSKEKYFTKVTVCSVTGQATTRQPIR